MLFISQNTGNIPSRVNPKVKDKQGDKDVTADLSTVIMSYC